LGDSIAVGEYTWAAHRRAWATAEYGEWVFHSGRGPAR
jgi:hypothetical protein